MASEAATPSLRLASPAPGGRSLLTGRRGTLKGELLVHNDGEDTLRLERGELRGDAEVRLERLEPVDVAPGSARTASVTAAVPALTPPGTYEAEIEVDGVTHPVTLLVTEDIALSLSEREIVVIAGEPRTKTISMHNAGNIALNVSHAGPVALEVDRPRQTLLQRIGVLPAEDPPADAPLATATVEVRTGRQDDDDEAPPPAPTVTARLDPPVTVAPGETVLGDWVVTVDGDLDPGLRYRAVASLYTTDIGFVVAPAQDAPRAGPLATHNRPATEGVAVSTTREQHVDALTAMLYPAYTKRCDHCGGFVVTSPRRPYSATWTRPTSRSTSSRRCWGTRRRPPAGAPSPASRRPCLAPATRTSTSAITIITATAATTTAAAAITGTGRSTSTTATAGTAGATTATAAAAWSTPTSSCTPASASAGSSP